MLLTKKIILFTILLYSLQVIASALVYLILKEGASGGYIIASHFVNIIVSTCVFFYFSWTHPVRPYLTAFIVGILAELLGVFVAAFILGKLIWEPMTLVIDIPALMIAVIVGVSLGAKYNRQLVE